MFRLPEIDIRANAFCPEEFFPYIDDRIMKRQYESYKEYYGSKQKLLATIFQRCFYAVLMDIIENNVTFVLPLDFGNYAEICIKQLTGDEFKEAYRIGRFNKVDYVLSEFTGNYMCFRYRYKNRAMKEKQIYLSGYLFKRLLEYTHKARKYY